MAEAPRFHSPITRLRIRLRELYHGKSPVAVRFRYGVLLVDLAIIGFFIATPLIRGSFGFYVVDYLIAALLAADIGARAATRSRVRDVVLSPIFWVDIIVLLTLLFPAWLYSFGFLRILRLWSLVHSNFFWETVGRKYDDTRWEDAMKTLATLVTFIFVATGFVYSFFVGQAEGLHGYIDALYFTVTSLTTTGYGDILLPGPLGKLLSIVIMLTGITLFVRMAQLLIRPNKVRFLCPVCGLKRHDPDAVHCKACGTTLNIPNED